MSHMLLLLILQFSPSSLFLVQIYNGDDYNGSRIVSRAHELRDAVCSLIFSFFFMVCGDWGFGFLPFFGVKQSWLQSRKLSFFSGAWNAVTDGPCTGGIL